MAVSTGTICTRSVHTKEFILCAQYDTLRETNFATTSGFYSGQMKYDAVEKKKRKTQNFNINMSTKLFLLFRAIHAAHRSRSYVAKYIIIITWNMHHKKI